MENYSQITKFLTKLGLSDNQANIYLTLVKQGVLTVLEISKKTNIPRTSIYRDVEDLVKLGLIEEIIEENTTKYKSADINRLEALIKEKESNIEIIKDLFPNISTDILHLTKKQQPDTKVLFYRGAEGVKQMVWNTLRTKELFRGYSYRMTDELVTEKFMQKWRQEFLNRGLKGKDLVSDNYIKSRKKKIGFSKAYPLSWQCKYIPSSILNIDYQIDIYNNVFALYNWYEGDVFGVEIYNQKVADFQKQLYDLIWKQGEDFEH